VRTAEVNPSGPEVFFASITSESQSSSHGVSYNAVSADNSFAY
jgi:hypothetical protein